MVRYCGRILRGPAGIVVMHMHHAVSRRQRQSLIDDLWYGEPGHPDRRVQRARSKRYTYTRQHLGFCA